jgi:ABC-type cobalamin/Fe3+-siderophores transport system ATPase subunit
LRNVSVRLGPRTVIGSDGGDSAGGFSLSLYDGELLILQAPNGWGKSTLLAFVLGLLPGIGEVILSVKRGLRAFPSGERGFPSLRVRDCMRLAGNHSATGNAEILPSRRLSSLSGGERQWVAWQCLWALRDRCQAVLLDEPFGGLDESHLRQIVKDLCHAPWRAALILVPQTAES